MVVEKRRRRKKMHGLPNYPKELIKHGTYIFDFVIDPILKKNKIFVVIYNYINYNLKYFFYHAKKDSNSNFFEKYI